MVMGVGRFPVQGAYRLPIVRVGMGARGVLESVAVRQVSRVRGKTLATVAMLRPVVAKGVMGSLVNVAPTGFLLVRSLTFFGCPGRARAARQAARGRAAAAVAAVATIAAVAAVAVAAGETPVKRAAVATARLV